MQYDSPAAVAGAEPGVDHSATVLLSVRDLKKGMYVSYLDRPWVETPFPFSGFEIRTDRELQMLRQLCEYVFIHTERGTHSDGYFRSLEARLTAADAGTARAKGLAPWPIESTTEDEFPRASAAVADVRAAVVEAFTAATRSRTPDLEGLKGACQALAESIERCPDAALFVVRTAELDDYLYRHATAGAVMGAVMGRALGLPPRLREDLAVGCALLDIGKTRVPQDLVSRPSANALTPAEMSDLRRHVQHGVEIVSSCPGVSQRVVTAIAGHHERYDGSGYPDGIRGQGMPLAAAIAGVIDLFDAMVSRRGYGRRATPHEAMRFVRDQRDRGFSATLADQFVQVFRLFPTGSLVELSDESVGRVVQQHATALLAPRVRVILDPGKERLHEYRTVQTSSLAGDAADVCVRRSLAPGSYGIDA
jgi:HD-GYP domain-containing protein (c-di-GMP phosphodiesterase class II)